MTQAEKKEIVTKPGSETSIVELDINSIKIHELSVRCNALSTDLKDEDSYRMTQDVINEARTMRGQIKAAGKGLKEDAAKWQKKVVAEEKRLDGEIVDFLEPLAARKKVYDDEVAAEKERKRIAEQLRKDTHLASINGIRILISKAQNKSSDEIEKVIDELEAIVIGESFEEFQKDAQDVYDDTDLALNKMMLDAQNLEEADRKRKEEDERLKNEREAIEKDRADLEKLREKQAEANKPDEEPAAETEPAAEAQNSVRSGMVGKKIQKKINEENNVIDQIEKNTLNSLEEIMCEHYVDGVFDEVECAKALLKAIRAKEIISLTYSIY